MKETKDWRDPNSLTPITNKPSKEEVLKYVNNVSSKTKLIKIHGLQRSGTNYIAHMLNENFIDVRCLINLAGWKHGFYCIPWQGKEVDVVVIAKSPYSWLASVYNYWKPPKKLNIGPNLNDVSFDEFCHSKALFELQAGIPFLYRASNPIQYWNNLNYHWCTIRLNDHKLIVVNYESLLYDPKGTLSEISNSLNLKPKNDDFIEINHDFVPAGEKIMPSKESWPHRNFYENKDYLKMYTPELLEFVNSELDEQLMQTLHYEYTTPEKLSEFL